MAKQVDWTKKIVETFIEEAMLSDLEQKVLKTRVQGWTRTKQAYEFNISMPTLDRCIATLKKKYDEVQKYHPDLPKRRVSKEEEYMDNN